MNFKSRNKEAEVQEKTYSYFYFKRIFNYIIILKLFFSLPYKTFRFINGRKNKNKSNKNIVIR